MAISGPGLPRQVTAKTRLRSRGRKVDTSMLRTTEVSSGCWNYWDRKWVRRDISSENERNSEAIAARTSRPSFPTYFVLEC